MRGVQREIERTGNTRFNAFDFESLILKRLRKMVEEKERDEAELGARPKMRSMTLDSDEYSREEKSDEDDVSVWGAHWLAKAFHSVEKGRQMTCLCFT